MTAQEYSYKPNAWRIAAATLFFVALSYGFMYITKTNDRGLIINHLIALSPTQATHFYEVLFGCCIIFVVMGIAGVIWGIMGQQKISLSEKELHISRRSLFQGSLTIPIKAIINLREYNLHSQKIIEIRCIDKKVCLARSYFSNASSGQEFLESLISCVRDAAAIKN